ncbi:FCD domain-containing protein [Caballeronia sp. LZ032]|uniref:FCD domain-containing protein n=1 Tax=Caballeronia sp. LZ032 TaxID=3038565 RepID=UPI002855D071|nr:FCD domain-containing protein [Caballeronia sp. LZ032]MDR5878017.1 hypothetical protein [Caballeronia sp. LZ032]
MPRLRVTIDEGEFPAGARIDEKEDSAANPVLANGYSTLMAKVHRARGAANADSLRWADLASEHEVILAALQDTAHAGLARILREHSENTAREVLDVLMRSQDDPAPGKTA